MELAQVQNSSSEEEALSIRRLKQLKIAQHKQMGNAQFVKYLKAHPGLDAVLSDLERLWVAEQVPEFYSEGLLWTLKLCDLEMILERLRQEFQLTQQLRTPYHRILQSVRCRHICMNKIAAQLSTIHDLGVLRMFRQKYTRDSEMDKLAEEARQDGYKDLSAKVQPQQALALLKTAFSDMCRLRELTVYVVELIHHWRKEVEEALDACNALEPVWFLLEGHNYYEQLRTDTNFIWHSDLSLYMFFEHDCDIFLVRNVLAIENLPQKQLLEKYFLEIVYPKDDKIFDRTVEAMQYLSYQTQPTLHKQHELEELLVENYIRMDYSPSKLMEEKLMQQQIERRLFVKEQAKEKLKQSPFSIGKKKPVIRLSNLHSKLEMQKKAGAKLSNLQKIIDEELDTIRIKPFSVVNYPAKNALELQFQYEAKERQPSEQAKTKFTLKKTEPETGKAEEESVINEKQTTFKLRHASMQHLQNRKATVSSVLRAMEQNNHKQKKQLNAFKHLYRQGNRSHDNIRNHNLSQTFGSPNSPFKAKINTFERKKNKSMEGGYLIEAQKTSKEEIEVEEGYIPLNKRIFHVFGTLPMRGSMSTVSKSRKRASMPPAQVKLGRTDKEASHLSLKSKNNQRSKELKPHLAERPEHLYDDYERITASKPQLQALGDSLGNGNGFFVTAAQQAEQPEEFLRLRPKSVPLDILEVYLRHLFEIRNPMLTLFTDYQLGTVLGHLTEAQKVFIFEVLDRSDDVVGELIVSEHVSKLGLTKYEVEFIHVDRFEFFVQAVLLLSERVFRVGGVEQLVMTLKLDKMDDVNREFVNLIDAKFGQRAIILEKKRTSYLGHDLHDRMYVMRRESTARLHTPTESYDTRLYVRANAFLFCSNFRLRKQSYLTQHFRSTNRELKLSIALLYAHILDKIMTKHHMRLLRTAAPHIKQLLLVLYRLKTLPDHDRVTVSEFKSTADLRTYLEYRSYDAEQRLLKFIEDSQFIMRKELVLAEFKVDLRLDYLVRQTVCRIDNQNYFYLMLENYRRHAFEVITSSEFCSELVVAPCGDEDGYELLLMRAEEYMKLDVDLYTYLNNFLQTEKRRVREVVDVLCLPEAVFRHKVTESDTLAEQFPEREFYYSGQLEFHTSRPLPLGIVRQPRGLVFECPLIVGFFRRHLEVCYLIGKQNMLKEAYS